MKFKSCAALSLLLLSIASMSFAIPSAHSVTYPTVYVNPQNNYAFVGQSFTVAVAIANVTNLNFWEGLLYFNPSVLAAINASIPTNNIFAGYSPIFGTPTINNTVGTISISAYLPTQSIGANGSGTLFQVLFSANVVGTSYLNIIKGVIFGTTRLFDRSGNLIDFTYVNGSVQVASSEIKLTVPFHYQTATYYSGPAALEMVFDKYGEDISQLEIAEVAGTHPNVTFTDWLRRAAHFSNMSTSMGQAMPQNITGYTLRKFGYGAFETQGLTINQLQGLVTSGYPIIVSTWYDLSKQSSQYRVVVGFNATHIYLHDPWNKAAWNGQYGGPYMAIPYTTFSTLWNQSSLGSYNWGLFVVPWQISLTINMLHLQPYSFNVTATIRYLNSQVFPGTSYAASLANATISLPTGLQLNAGETSRKRLGTGNLSPGGSATVSWIVNGTTTTKYTIRVQAGGKISGTVASHGIYQSYNYQDIIGGNASINVYLGGTLSSPYPGDINGDGKVDIKDLARAGLAYGSHTGSPKWDPVADITGPTGVPDGKVDIRDIASIAKHYGQSWP
jgi:hypothetical protein